MESLLAEQLACEGPSHCEVRESQGQVHRLQTLQMAFGSSLGSWLWPCKVLSFSELRLHHLRCRDDPSRVLLVFVGRKWPINNQTSGIYMAFT